MAKTTSSKSGGTGSVKLPKFQEIGSRVTGSMPTSVKTPPPPPKK